MKIKNILAIILTTAITFILTTKFGKVNEEMENYLFTNCFTGTDAKCTEIYYEYSMGNMIHYGSLIALSVPLLILILSIALEVISDSSNNNVKLKLSKFLFTEEEEKSFEEYVNTSTVKFRKKTSGVELRDNHFYCTTFKRFSPDLVNETGKVNTKQLEHISNLHSMNEGRYIWVYSKVLVKNKIQYVLDFCLVD